VEIGPGTGQATLPLAERGFEIVGVELGERLTAFAREKLSAFNPAVIRRYLWDVQYDVDSYINVLETYSGHRSIPEDRRKDLYERIRRRIGDSEVSTTMLAILHVARA
jgi:hypothetical protein